MADLRPRSSILLFSRLNATDLNLEIVRPISYHNVNLFCLPEAGFINQVYPLKKQDIGHNVQCYHFTI